MSPPAVREATLGGTPRLLIVPGLNDSGPLHWQTWLQSQYRHARRVVQDDWTAPELEGWADRIGTTLAGDAGPWIAVAHSFGCLALARHLEQQPGSAVRAALFVAPAEPDKFGVADRLPQGRLGVSSTIVASDTDPWMTAASTRLWAQRWGSAWVTIGDAGHVNAESGFATLPLARRWVTAMSGRLARERRPQRAALGEWSFAV